ncbi:MAG: YraN family protein [Candidatus Riflebacteria bacterium]|nr:YraN family protein [Candidatus Riflebacteria bacterium]
MSKTEFGKNSENIAVSFLEKLGYKILFRNFRSRNAEIDIIAMDSSCLVFVEVRSKTKTDFGHPFETISLHKQRKIISAAQFFLMKNRLFETKACRFDVLAIVDPENKTGVQIEHLKNAFST